jgi:hypothetical protein
MNDIRGIGGIEIDINEIIGHRPVPDLVGSGLSRRTDDEISRAYFPDPLGSFQYAFATDDIKDLRVVFM